MFYAETLFLVQYQQPQFVEFYVLAQQSVCAYENVDVALGGGVEYFLLLVGRAEAVYAGDLDVEVRHTLAKTVVVLFGKNGSRRKHCHLIAVAYHVESGAHCDFRFAVTDVAHKHTVHDFVRHKVGFDFLLALNLVVRCLVGEVLLKLFFEVVVDVIAETALFFTLGIQFEQVYAHCLDAGFYLAFYLGKILAADTRQSGIFTAGVATEHVAGVHRHIQTVAVFVQHHDVVALAVADFYFLYALAQADTVPMY